MLENGAWPCAGAQSVMASALVASGVSRLISAPLYTSLTQLQLQRLPKDEAKKKSPEGL